MKNSVVKAYRVLSIQWPIFLLMLFAVLPSNAAGRFDGENAFRFLTMQTDLGPRNPGSAGHRACLNLLKTQLQKSGARVELQPFMHYDEALEKSFTMTNIIGSFAPDKTAQIMLCAHWDTRPFADRDTPENRNKPIPGANDGASGVAVLLEVAAQLQKISPPVGVDIVFFDGEDYGREGDLENYCLGARHFTGTNTRFFPQFAILLDMIGDARLQIPREGYSQQYAPEVVKQVWTLAEELGYYQFEPEVRSYVFDDHIILNEAGIPAIDIIDFEYPDAGHHYWHTLQDIPDNCSAGSLQVVGDVLLKLIYEMQP